MSGRLVNLLAVIAMAAGCASATAADLRVLPRTDVPLAANEKSSGIPEESIAQVLPYKGDPAGIRRWLASHGIEYSFIYTNDVLSNLRGGLQRGTIDQGKLEGALTIDWEKLAGIKGLSFYANFFQIHNTGRMRRDYVGGINTIAAIEAMPTTRLSELWMEQKFWNGMASVKLGQFVADVEFFQSELGFLFLENDWPTITAVNLPSGGPAYPLSTPGVRLKFDPNKYASFLLAVFNGDPAGPGLPGRGAGPQSQRHELPPQGSGLHHRRGPVHAEPGQERHRPGQQAEARRLGPSRRIRRPSLCQRYALCWPIRRAPACRRGGAAIPGSTQSSNSNCTARRAAIAQSGVSMFTRISASPSDRNLVDFFVDGGSSWRGWSPAGRMTSSARATCIHASPTRARLRSGQPASQRCRGADPRL